MVASSELEWGIFNVIFCFLGGYMCSFRWKIDKFVGN